MSKRICERKYNDQRRLHIDTVFQHFTTHFKFFPYVRTETVKPWQTEEVTTVLRIPETEYKALFDRYYDVKKSIMVSDAKKSIMISDAKKQGKGELYV